jgi:hypothetical protein
MFFFLLHKLSSFSLLIIAIIALVWLFFSSVFTIFMFFSNCTYGGGALSLFLRRYSVMILSLHFAGFWRGRRVGEHWKGQNTPGKGGWCWVCYLPFSSYFNTIIFFFSLLSIGSFFNLYIAAVPGCSSTRKMLVTLLCFSWPLAVPKSLWRLSARTVGTWQSRWDVH